MKKLLQFSVMLLCGSNLFGQALNLDFAGNVNNSGTMNFPTKIVGSLSYGADRNGNQHCALTFGTPIVGYLEISGMNSFNFFNPFSMAVWFRTYNNGYGQYIFTKGLYRGSIFEDFSEALAQGYLSYGGSIPNYSSTSISSKTPWYFLVLVSDGDSITTYLNSEPVAKEKAYINGAKSDTAMIGYNFSGDMDNFQLYDHALSATQVDSLYKLPVSCGSTVTDVTTAALPRITISRNGEQIQLNNFEDAPATYTITDPVGRIISEGQIEGYGQVNLVRQEHSMLILQVNFRGKYFSNKF